MFSNQDHTNEPGWLAGQIRDKVGWFPEAYAEAIDASAGQQRQQPVTSPTGSLNVQQKLPSIHETLNEEAETVRPNFDGNLKTSRPFLVHQRSAHRRSVSPCHLSICGARSGRSSF